MQSQPTDLLTKSVTNSKNVSHLCDYFVNSGDVNFFKAIFLICECDQRQLGVRGDSASARDSGLMKPLHGPPIQPISHLHEEERRRHVASRECFDADTFWRRGCSHHQRRSFHLWVFVFLCSMVETSLYSTNRIYGHWIYGQMGYIVNTPVVSSRLLPGAATKWKWTWKETKQQPSMLPSPAVPGCCLVSFHILWAILWPHTV